MNRFLLAKHWQLFTLMFGVPLLFDVFLFAKIFSEAVNGNVVPMFNIFKFFPLIIILVVGIQFGWFWSVGVGLQHKIPETVKMKVKKFKIFFFIPAVYLLVIICGLFVFLGTLDWGALQSSDTPPVNPAYIGIGMLIIMPLHLFSMFCIFYCLYFVAKTLKTAEMQKEVQFSDFVGEFFMIWFYPIGIWFIQPRINKLMQEQELPGDSEAFLKDA